ncbi:unnamed protein product [Rhodiola kirilowii]
MGGSEAAAAALHTAANAVQALGKGFDVNYDTRLLYCKGVAGSRLVEVDEHHTRDLVLYDGIVVPNVSKDIRSYQDKIRRETSGICDFSEMVEYFNNKAGVSESFPLGCMNSAFSFTGSRQCDATATKTLFKDGVIVPLAKVQLTNCPLVLSDGVKRALPTTWDPPALSSFIENFGTHVITSVTIGGKDVIYVKQHHSSPLTAMEMKNYVEEIGNKRFSSAEACMSSALVKYNEKTVHHYLFNSQAVQPQPAGTVHLAGKEDVTVILRRRGGDDLEQNHSQWVKTVWSAPDVIEMTFFPIASLLEGVSGREHLVRAIGLYLEYKPQLEELRYFLEFQTPKVWAPVQDNRPGHLRKEPVCKSLQFSLMGQKLYVCPDQVSVGRKPVTGLCLCLEGSKLNRLSIHVQHLASLPKILRPYWDTHVAIGAPKWLGPEEQDSRWFEPVKWKNFSHVSTAPIENHESFISDVSGAHIVSGAQLGVWDFGSRNVLYMKLLFSRLPGCSIRRSVWDQLSSNKSHIKSSTTRAGDSGSGSNDNKFVKVIDTSEMSKGPQDAPGHWLVTGAKLAVENGKISLRVKYSLLNY